LKGVFNKIVAVQLSERKSSALPISDTLYDEYLGGRGLGVKLLVDRLPAHTDPLDPKNPLIFTVGPLTATAVPTAGRSSLVTKSPLTGGIFYSNTGGFFGAFLKRCGTDGLLIEGALDKPGYIVLNEKGEIEIKDGAALWGLDTRQTMQKLHDLEGKNIHAVMIGPAGENLVKIAAIMNDGDHRAFGRGGVGAVMGSKKLKAIVIKAGTAKPEIADSELLKTYVKNAVEKIRVAPITRASLPLFGTAGLVNIINELGMLPINNFQKGYSEEAEKVSGEAIREQILQKDEACFGCPIRCGRLTKAGDMEGKGPEYESVVMLGPTTGVFDLVKVTQANYLCNLLGIDTISGGVTIACAMELQQKGKLHELGLTFGNAEILPIMLKKIATREGIGNDLAEGSARLAAKYGAPELSMAVKKMELPAYDPRGAMGHALGYATSTRGGCHLTGYLAAMEIFAAPKKIPRNTTGGKADLLVLKQHSKAVEDSLVTCAFAGWAIGFDFNTRFMHTVTGLDFNITKLMQIGERIYNLERMFNLREGIGMDQDTLPPRFLTEKLPEGFTKDATVPLKGLLEDYYSVRKWDKKGYPKAEKLKELNLTLLEGL
jgi:aldehyde:ferredoxin oxidoreductase